MMFGWRDQFEYIECFQCGCLQIKEIPRDISRYYPDNYYSFHPASEDQLVSKSIVKVLKRKLKEKLIDDYLSGKGIIGKLLEKKYYSYYPWLKRGMLKSNSSILDIGCGSGELLLKMYHDGFRSLTGIDPFIQDHIHYRCGITIYKSSLFELTTSYDLIMMHHAFEHMEDPLSIFKKLYELLTEKGMIIIRIPVAGSYAWRKYGVNWVQLDAPRHYYLHTVKSIQILCDKTNLNLKDVQFDSYDFQFIGSEKYMRNIPLLQQSSEFDLISKNEFKKEAVRLNKIHDGDSACFYLTKT